MLKHINTILSTSSKLIQISHSLTCIIDQENSFVCQVNDLDLVDIYYPKEYKNQTKTFDLSDNLLCVVKLNG